MARHYHHFEEHQQAQVRKFERKETFKIYCKIWAPIIAFLLFTLGAFPQWMQLIEATFYLLYSKTESLPNENLKMPPVIYAENEILLSDKK